MVRVIDAAIRYYQYNYARYSFVYQTVEMHAVSLKYDRPVQQFIRDYYLTANRLEDV